MPGYSESGKRNPVLWGCDIVLFSRKNHVNGGFGPPAKGAG
jgi:hypothetical protein